MYVDRSDYFYNLLRLTTTHAIPAALIKAAKVVFIFKLQ